MQNVTYACNIRDKCTSNYSFSLVLKCCTSNLGLRGDMIYLTFAKFLDCLKELTVFVIAEFLATIVKCVLPAVIAQLTGPRSLRWVKPRRFAKRPVENDLLISTALSPYRREMFFSLAILFRAKSAICMAWIRTKMKKR